MDIRFENILDKDGFDFTLLLPGSSAETGANFDVVFPISRPCEVVGYFGRWSGAAATGTVQLQKLADGVAPGSGINMLSAAISLAGTINQIFSGDTEDFLTSVSRIFIPGEALGFSDGGSLTGLRSLSLTIYFRPIGKGHYV